MDPSVVSVLCVVSRTYCFAADRIKTCGCVPLDLGSALHCTGLIEVDHGPLGFGRAFTRRPGYNLASLCR